MKHKTLISSLITIVLISCNATLNAKQAQMEIRKSEEYDAQVFNKSKPAVGEVAPDLLLHSLDGKEVALSSFRGKNIVVVKAGYT